MVEHGAGVRRVGKGRLQFLYSSAARSPLEGAIAYYIGGLYTLDDVVQNSPLFGLHANTVSALVAEQLSRK